MIPRRAALAASACARPASTSISIDSLASPVASPKATPVADVSATGDEALNGQAITEIEQLVATVAACQTSGDYKTLAELLTPAYIQEVYGAGTALSVSEFVQFGKDLPIQSVAIQSVSDVRVNAKGEISSASTPASWIRGHSKSVIAM